MADDEKSKVRLISRSSGESEPRLKPILLEYKKLKKKDQDEVNEDVDADVNDGEKKYSRGLGDIQRLEGNVVRVAQKATKALSKGVEVYEREREQSAREKTDGAIEDFIHNSAKATSAYLKETSDIPVDLAESINNEPYRVVLRKNLKRASKFISLWRI
jgi:hypothetical protein